LTACTFGGLCALAAAKVLYLPARWGRSAAVETAGVALLSASAALAVLSTHPMSVKDAALAAGASSSLFLPGVARAKLLKGGSSYQRVALLGLAICGATFLVALVRWSITAPFGALAALAFAGDVRAAIVKPKTTTRHLGFLLTLRGALAATILALAWRRLA
jgi:hypothetical protein